MVVVVDVTAGVVMVVVVDVTAGGSDGGSSRCNRWG